MRLVPAPHLLELGRPAGRAAEQRVEQRGETLPFGAGARRRVGHQHRGRIGRGEPVEDARRARRADAGHELRDAKARDAVARVLGKAQRREHVLHVRGFEELQPAELHERDVAPGQLEFERVGMMRGAEQHRLRFQRQARLAVLQHAVDHVARLIRLVAHRDQQRALPRLRARDHRFLVKRSAASAITAFEAARIGCGRAVVLLQRDDARRRREVAGKVEDVAHGRGAERIDRLRVVADHRQAAPVGLERQQDRRLQPVGVLILVDQHVVEARADLGGERRARPACAPSRAAGRRSRARSGAASPRRRRRTASSARPPSCAHHGNASAQHLVQRRLACSPRANRSPGTCPWSGSGFSRARQTELVAHQVHQVGGVLAVVDGEGAVEPDALGVFAQQPRADGVERAGPGEAGRRVRAARAVEDALGARAPSRRRRGARRSAAGCGAGRRRSSPDARRDAPACRSCPSPRPR